MSQNTQNYTDGIPVKISEKYKPPPKVYLPQSIFQRLTNTELPILSKTYELDLERNVLQKIVEWKNVRDRERNERHERIRIREQERCKQMEEKQKQLLTQVSYPSTEDLSSEDEIPYMRPEQEKVSHVTPQGHFSPPNQFDTILKPTIVPGTYIYDNTTCQPFSQNKENIQQNLSKINYSDFENDTSSPFDNMELKTMNDLDILAQVLNKTAKIQIKNAENESTESNPTEQLIGVHVTSNENCYQTNYQSQTLTENIKNSNDYELLTSYVNNINNQNISSKSIQSHLHPQIENNSMPPSGALLVAQYPTNFSNINENYSSNYATTNNHSIVQTAAGQYTSPIHNYDVTKNGYFYYNAIQPTAQNFNSPPNNYILSSDFSGANYQPSDFAMNYNSPEGEVMLKSQRSKSKSVPDIMNELHDEIRNSEMKRIRKTSQTICSPVDEFKETPLAREKNEDFKKLSASSQKVAINISTMGFPLELVSRVIRILGNDDKKIVEHLIPLSELLDLGFEESKISEALLKFNNNKDKALDFLIS